MRCGGRADCGERELLKGFIDLAGAGRPRLASFNGRAFDLPVVWYRAMACGLSAPLLTSRGYDYRYDLEGHCDLLDLVRASGAEPPPLRPTRGRWRGDR